MVWFFCLLIVPYGIETSIEYTSFHNFVLLIVPYGIETSSMKDLKEMMTGF